MKDGSLFQILILLIIQSIPIDYSPIVTGTVVWSDQYGNILSDSLSLTVQPDTGSVYYYISVYDVCTEEIINNVDSVFVQTFAASKCWFSRC